MRNFIYALVAGSLFATPSLALDEHTQHNYKIKSGNLAVTYRDHVDLDKWMTQVDYKFAGFGYAYRYQESKGKVEHRLRLNTPTLVKVGNVKVSSRIELRDFETTDDYGNIWLRIQYNQKITDSLSAYVTLQPKFAFGNDKYDDGDFYTSQNLIGVNYKVGDGVTLGIFAEKNTADKLSETKSIFLGTNLSYKF